jgi:hypothetical protein
MAHHKAQDHHTALAHPHKDLAPRHMDLDRPHKARGLVRKVRGLVRKVQEVPEVPVRSLALLVPAQSLDREVPVRSLALHCVKMTLCGSAVVLSNCIFAQALCVCVCVCILAH